MKKNLFIFLIVYIAIFQSLAIASTLVATAENIHELEYKARAGDLVASEALGRLYIAGLAPDVAKNISKAIVFLEPVAEEGDGPAQELVANAYLEGEVGENYYDKYLYWIDKAAENGLPRAKYQLAKEYFEGNLGAGIDLERAYFWVKSAADDHFPGSKKAAFFIGIKYVDSLEFQHPRRCKITTDLVALNESWYTELYRKANCGHPMDDRELIQILREASEDGSSYASYFLADHYRSLRATKLSQSYMDLAKLDKLVDKRLTAELIGPEEFNTLTVKITQIKDLNSLIAQNNPNLVNLEEDDGVDDMMLRKNSNSLELTPIKNTAVSQGPERTLLGSIGDFAIKTVFVAVVLPLSVLALAAEGSGSIDNDIDWMHLESSGVESVINPPSRVISAGDNIYVTNGRTTTGSDGSIYSTNRAGTVTTGSDGSIYSTNRAGTVTIGSDGSIYSTSGNTTTSSSGIVCINSGSAIICN